jgi:hypothetical protein
MSAIGPKRKSRDVWSELRTIPDVTLIRRAGESFLSAMKENGDAVNW